MWWGTGPGVLSVWWGWNLCRSWDKRDAKVGEMGNDGLRGTFEKAKRVVLVRLEEEEREREI